MLFAKHLFGISAAESDGERVRPGVLQHDACSVPTSPKIHELRARFEIERHGKLPDIEKESRDG